MFIEYGARIAGGKGEIQERASARKIVPCSWVSSSAHTTAEPSGAGEPGPETLCACEGSRGPARPGPSSETGSPAQGGAATGPASHSETGR